MPLNEAAIGKTYTTEPFEVTDHEGIFYALGYNEDNDAYFDKRREGGTIIPPMYAVKYMIEAVAKVIMDQDTGMNMAMVVHYTQEFDWIKPVKAGDKISSECKITGIEVKQKGGVLKWEIVSKNQKDEIVTKSKWSFFDRSAGSGEPDVRPEAVEPDTILHTQEMFVKNGQTWMYAEPSGDFNPIHVDDNMAKNVGLGGIILQGLCTMAFTHKICVDNLAGSDKEPTKIKKLALQFARPVKPGETIKFELHKTGEEGGGTKYGIIAKNPDGKHVLRDAWCLAVD